MRVLRTSIPFVRRLSAVQKETNPFLLELLSEVLQDVLCLVGALLNVILKHQLAILGTVELQYSYLQC